MVNLTCKKSDAFNKGVKLLEMTSANSRLHLPVTDS